jgi:hypothetical protein
MNIYPIIKINSLRYLIAFIATVFSIGISFKGVAQLNVIDSLKLVEINTDDQDKPVFYTSLAKYYSNVNIDSAIYNGNKGLVN